MESIEKRKQMTSRDLLQHKWRQQDQDVFWRVKAELQKIRDKWGQSIPEGGSGTHIKYKAVADLAKQLTDMCRGTKDQTWLNILAEEVYEAFAETETEPLVAELIQVIAVCVRWIETIENADTVKVGLN